MLRVENQGPSNRGDMGDQAAISLEREVQVGIAVAKGLEQQEMQEAEWRKDKGLHGICKDCGNPIEPARLKARPFAVQCVACKEAEESEIGFKPGRRK